MKTFITTIILSIIGILLNANFTFAQGENAGNKIMKQDKIKEKQLAKIKENRAEQIAFRDAFRKTLSNEQLEMLNNPEISNEDKLKSLRKSLSNNQIKTIRKHKNLKQNKNSMIKGNIANHKRMQIRRTMINNFQQNKTKFPRSHFRRNSPM